MQKSGHLHIPDIITVHLGNPDFEAPNITVPFISYIKNVVCSETLPDWPENALIANIYAIVSFTLNRYYTQWYRSKGCFFDITNDTRYDPAFLPSQSVFKNIDHLVNEWFNNYVIRLGSGVPLLCEFCNGTSVVCEGLSQVGAVRLAERGASAYEILMHYFGEDISIMQNAPLASGVERYAGTPLLRGASGENILTIKHQLNHIGANYTAIPRIPITSPNFDRQTEIAVRAFQNAFLMPVNGVIDKATWYQIKFINLSVQRHRRLMKGAFTTAGQVLPFMGDMAYGEKSMMVFAVQYYMSLIGYFYPLLNVVPLNGIYGPATYNAVTQFQRLFGLPVTGIIDEKMFCKLTALYRAVLGILPGNYPIKKARGYPGYIMSEGTDGHDVWQLKTYLTSLGIENDELPVVPVTCYFGTQTRAAVLALQRLFGLPQSGDVGPETWACIAGQYDLLTGATD